MPWPIIKKSQFVAFETPLQVNALIETSFPGSRGECQHFAGARGRY